MHSLGRRIRIQTLLRTVTAWVALVLACPDLTNGEEPPRSLAPPVEDGPFLRPAPGEASEPVWGVKGGIAVGLWPTPGPRGLIRVYTPYLGQPRLRMINYIAVEPVTRRGRGLSELEPSDLDGAAGKAFWTEDTRLDDPQPRPPWQPARGQVTTRDGVNVLSVFVHIEPFENGARPVVEITLRDDRPHEVGFRVHASPRSAPMGSCVLTATMGNYARLRHLWLRQEVIDAPSLFQDAEPGIWDFLPAHTWGVDSLLANDGHVLVAATTDEADPQAATYAEDVPPWWRYQGRPGTQYWRVPAHDDLVVRVNGRATYWAGQARIPGGASFENFEVELPFQNGQAFHFGVIPGTPEALGFDPDLRPDP